MAGTCTFAGVHGVCLCNSKPHRGHASTGEAAHERFLHEGVFARASLVLLNAAKAVSHISHGAGPWGPGGVRAARPRAGSGLAMNMLVNLPVPSLDSDMCEPAQGRGEAAARARHGRGGALARRSARRPSARSGRLRRRRWARWPRARRLAALRHMHG